MAPALGANPDDGINHFGRQFQGLLTLFGACDQHLRRIRNALGVSISSRDGQIHIVGPEGAVASATEVLEQLQVCAPRTR